MAIHLNQVLSQYNIGKPRGARPVERGFINENWKIETTLGSYFLKHYHPDLRHPDVIRAQHTLVAHLRQAGFPAPATMPTTDGDTLLIYEEEFYFTRFRHTSAARSTTTIDLDTSERQH
jgi:Ser/Thr protein kinase RdoA (MazF antagonist)